MVGVRLLGVARGPLVPRTGRECSTQRRHKKLIEESPAPNLPATVKARLTEAAVAGGKAVGYVNAGTMEFVVAGGEFFFLQMNTRLPGEHPAAEEGGGLRPPQAPLRGAAGEAPHWEAGD